MNIYYEKATCHEMLITQDLSGLPSSKEYHYFVERKLVSENSLSTAKQASNNASDTQAAWPKLKSKRERLGAVKKKM